MTKSNTRRFIGAAWSLLTFQLIAGAGAVAVTGYAALQIQPRLAPVEQPAPEQAAEAPGGEQPAGAPPNQGAATLTLEGDAAVGARLRAVLSEDPDGMSSRPRFQWLRDGEVIPGAMRGVYAPTEADSGHSLAARADYVDGAGYAESVISPAVAVTAVTPACQRAENLIRVPANVGWCDTGLVVEAGQPLVIRARGRWSSAGAPNVGPEGHSRYRDQNAIMPNAARAALIGRIGDAPFAIGEGVQHASNVSGPLHLSINDAPSALGDNQGFVDVYVATGGAGRVVQ